MTANGLGIRTYGIGTLVHNFLVLGIRAGNTRQRYCRLGLDCLLWIVFALTVVISAMLNEIPTAPARLPYLQPENLFQALGTPTLLAMIRRLATDGTLSVNDFVLTTEMSQAGVSKHLEILRLAGVVVKAPSPDGDLRKHCYMIPPAFLVVR